MIFFGALRDDKLSKHNYRNSSKCESKTVSSVTKSSHFQQLFNIPVLWEKKTVRSTKLSLRLLETGSRQFRSHQTVPPVAGIFWKLLRLCSEHVLDFFANSNSFAEKKENFHETGTVLSKNVPSKNRRHLESRENRKKSRLSDAGRFDPSKFF